jgi:hypothetical protein
VGKRVAQAQGVSSPCCSNIPESFQLNRLLQIEQKRWLILSNLFSFVNDFGFLVSYDQTRPKSPQKACLDPMSNLALRFKMPSPLVGEYRSCGLAETAGHAVSFFALRMDGDEVKEGGETNHRLLQWTGLCVFLFFGGQDCDSRSRKPSQRIANHREGFRLFLVPIAHVD